MRSRLVLLAVLSGAVVLVGAGSGVGATPPTTQCAPAADYPAATTPVAFWSTEARCAIVPAGPGGVFGSENFGNKFPGEAAVYMGIVHVAIYDAAVAIEGGYQPYAITPSAPADTSPEAAIATAAYDTLTGLPAAAGRQPGDPRRRLRRLHGRDPGRPGEGGRDRRRPAGRPQAVLALRANDGRGCEPRRVADLDLPAPGARRLATRARGRCSGLRLPGMRPLALDERLAVPARRPQRADQPGVRRGLQPGQGARPRRQHDQDARADQPGAASGPTTTSGSGTTACSASPPPAASTSCRPPACWRWRTSPAATR